jgi:ubiquinone/menaquinone biosynthesis C-methylase UbiE
MITCDYSGIAKQYDLWSMGDAAYVPVANFYLSYLIKYDGVFAELGVGTGRIALPLSMKPNVFIYGIDSCKSMLEQCRKKMNNNTKLDLICADFINFKLPQKADVIYMPFRTIGHILDKSELESFFNNVYMNLKEKGVFIFDHYMFNKEWALAHNDVEIIMFENDNMQIIDRYVYDFENNIMHCTVSCNNEIVALFDFHWINVEEIQAIYPLCGFELTALYGDFDGSSLVTESPNQIWVLRRPE